MVAMRLLRIHLMEDEDETAAAYLRRFRRMHARIPDVHAYDQLYQKLIERVALSDVSGSFVMEELKQVTELPLTFL